MNRMLLAAVLAAAVTATTTAGAAECDPGDGGLSLPEGFCALVVADDLGPARHVTVTEQGDLYIALRDRGDDVGGIAALRDTNGDGRMDEQMRFGENAGTGIRVHSGYLYFGEDRRVMRYPLHEQYLGPADGDPEVIAAGFPVAGLEAGKSLAFDRQGHLYISAAHSCAADAAGTTDGTPQGGCLQPPPAGGIWRFDAHTPGQDRQEDGEPYATGLRHALAMAWNPVSDSLYAVQQGDHDPGTGAATGIMTSAELLRIPPGSDFGWPHCYQDGAWQVPRTTSPSADDDARCAPERPPPELTFHRIREPADMLFHGDGAFPERYQGGAFVTFRSSVGENAQDGVIVFVAFTDDGRADPHTTAFATARSPQEAAGADGGRGFQPMGLAAGPDGSLYVTDSRHGRVWRIMYGND